MDELEITEGKLKRLRNLKLYKDKTDDEIREMLKQSRTNVKVSRTDRDYDARFREKFDLLKDEYALDMNSSNDIEMLTNLVRHLLQAEDAHGDIRAIQGKEDKSKEDIALLKALGEFQRDLQISISDLQDKLGISRKVRKEKQADDIPQFIDGILLKAKDFFNRKTITIECPKCKIELVRYWLNFPETVTLASFTSECPHCGEKVVHNR